MLSDAGVILSEAKDPRPAGGGQGARNYRSSRQAERGVIASTRHLVDRRLVMVSWISFSSEFVNPCDR